MQTQKKFLFVQHRGSPTLKRFFSAAWNDASWEANRHGGRSHPCKLVTPMK